MNPKPLPLGIFVSYNETDNGPFQKAVDVCTAHQYVVWIQRKRIRKKRFSLPTTILIKISGEDRYYRGQVDEIKDAEEVDQPSLLAESTHRPLSWQAIDKNLGDFKTVLHISGLLQVARPPGISEDEAPESPHYLAEAILQGLVPLPEEYVGSAKLVEGATYQVTINAYERNRIAKKDCIDHYGVCCAVCGLSMKAVYGSVAEEYIHVHHLIPLSKIQEEYEVDPIADLRPVCPNCHAIIHLGGKCRSIEDVRSLIDPRVLEFWASLGQD